MNPYLVDETKELAKLGPLEPVTYPPDHLMQHVGNVELHTYVNQKYAQYTEVCRILIRSAIRQGDFDLIPELCADCEAEAERK